ncbi:alpha/beta fold hydrolase [Actinomadura sp. HBU206391]|uniref:alpha/beta fold hydrolase n=1 Tax=Actinomadura sp. HBU206391 TaxID=2731692 RepID=UPI0016507688|nr:alpha/beta fold hydrolase [Actinomadura sp. HBU206391]MBC6460561.1 alpha/beta fold hydrolase [Actinomadura sp. HBU206391]
MSTFRHPGTVLTDHTFTVPLDHDDPGGEQIELYARGVVAADHADARLPWLLFLQGGPGFGGPRPVGRQDWLDRALDDYRVLLLDQRGTGRSTPANRHTLPQRGDAKAQADYLARFRADSIVRDSEAVRRSLIGDEPWSVLGQSFGGFCTVTYLSFAPDGVREAFITGGLPGLDATADDVYRAAYPRMVTRNAEYYEAYPGDVDRVRRLAAHLRDHDVRLPGGGRFTVEALQALGRVLGTLGGGHRLHYLLEDAFAGGSGSDLPGLPPDGFLYDVEAQLTFAAGPLYALLHEPCYGQSASGASRWSAQRIRAEFPEFDPDAALDEGAPVLFTGEMIYPWMFDTDPVLQPLRETAELLAERDSWPDLYDAGRLRANEVPVAAAVYHDDMYVEREHSLRTARSIRGLRPWITNEYEHSALRTDGVTVLDRLIAQVRGNA